MARPRKFTEDQVLQCAMMTFWRIGFDATTMRELERASGVGVRSLHNAFGEKDELFVRALRRYRDMVGGLLAEMFKDPGPETIAQLFEATAAPTETADDPRNAGCLVVNTVFETPELTDAAEAEVIAYRRMFIDAFRTALEAGGIEDAEARSEYLLGSLWGVFSQIRLAKSTAGGAPMAGVVAETVRGWARRADARNDA